MSREFEDRPQCKVAQSEITAWLYGEIAADTLRWLEAHLASCEACRRVRQQRERTKAQLSLWEAPVAGPVSVRVPTRTWFHRLRPVAAGLLAAVTVFATLSAVGTSVSRSEGRLVIVFGDSGDGTVSGRLGIPRVDDSGFKKIARDVCDDRLRSVESGLAQVFNQWEEIDGARRAGFAEAIARQWALERLRLARALDDLRHVTREESEILREALLVVSRASLDVRERDNNR